MKILVTIATLFVIGSVAGYIIELFFRRFVSRKKWVNPGFMVGPYIPLYGFGTAILFGFSNIDFSFLGLPNWVSIIITLIAVGLSLTLIELIAGLIFIKGFKMKLWDYSDRWGNFKGLICPLFSAIWMVVGVGYYFLLNPVLVRALFFIYDYPLYVFFVGTVVGMMIVDFCYSLHVGLLIKKYAGVASVKFEEFKATISEKAAEGKKKASFYTTHFLNKDTIKEYLTSYYEKQKERAEKIKNKLLGKK